MTVRHSRPAALAARTVALRLLGRLRHDRLVVHERFPDAPRATHVFGAAGTGPAALSGSIVVHDRRAYAAIVYEGSIGLGRGYIEGWWSSDDPVAVVRVLIRNMEWFDRVRDRLARVTGPISDRVRLALPRDSQRRNRSDIAAHYDIGNEFFALFLDETMTYSSAVFPTPDASLADASRHKYDLLLDKLELADEHELLEIGTGWGGLAIRAVERIGCRVTTTTISDAQLHAASDRVAAAGLSDRVTLLDQDWRDLSGTFDRVISIEMIEAVDWRDYDAFFTTIQRCLAPGGRAAIQAICLPDSRWARAKNTEDFIKHFVFPNGFLPSIAAITESVERATRLRVVDVEDFTAHYAETLRHWRERFRSKLDEVRALGLDDRFCRLWDFYLAYCEAGFRERHCTLAQIVLAAPDLSGA